MRWALMALVLLVGCGTKVLELGPAQPDALPPPPFPYCETYNDGNGDKCMRCHEGPGVEPTTTCTSVNAPPGSSKCTVKPVNSIYDRCIWCDGMQIACLKCEPPAPVGACARCSWSDNAVACEICEDKSGTPRDTCNVMRPELKSGP